MSRSKAGPHSGPHSGDTPGSLSGELDPQTLELSAADAMLAELAGAEDARIYVYRAPTVEDKEQTDEFLARFQASELGDIGALLELLRDKFGGGKFKLRANRSGRWIGAARTVRVIKPPVPAVSTSPTEKPAGDAIEGALKTIGSIIGVVAGAVTPIVTALAGRPAPAPVQGLSVSDAVALAKLTDKGNPVELLRSLIDVRDLLREREKEDSIPTGANWLDIVNNLIGQLGPALRAPTSAPPMPAAVHPPMPVPLPAGQAAVNPEPTATAPPPASAARVVQHPQADPVRALIQFCLDGARVDSDPAAYAVIVADRIGHEAVKQLLAQPDPVAVLIAAVPEAAQFREWIAEMIVALREGLITEQATEDSEHAAHGDSAAS